MRRRFAICGVILTILLSVLPLIHGSRVPVRIEIKYVSLSDNQLVWRLKITNVGSEDVVLGDVEKHNYVLYRLYHGIWYRCSLGDDLSYGEAERLITMKGGEVREFTIRFGTDSQPDPWFLVLPVRVLQEGVEFVFVASKIFVPKESAWYEKRNAVFAKDMRDYYVDESNE